MFRLTFQLLVILVAMTELSAATYYLDPESGSLANDGSASAPWPGLEEVIDAGLVHTRKYTVPYEAGVSTLTEVNAGSPIIAGDTLLLMTGLHGRCSLTNAHNTDFITIRAANDAEPIVREVHIRSGSKWRFEGLHISSEPYGEYLQSRLLWLETHGWQGPISEIDISDCFMYSTLDSGQWTAEDWLAKGRSGAHLDGNDIKISDCYILNVDFGISMIGDSIKAVGNTIENFSGDGMRMLGSYLLAEANLIMNCYKVDDNHDDGIQSFNLGTYNTSNSTIRGNTIINHTDEDQPLKGPLQGIGFFDGPFTNWVIENNVISVNHWHGISLYGAYDCIIRNNTVVDPTPDVTPGASWIRINPDKDGTPSSGNVVANNISNTLALTGSTEVANLLLTEYSDYETHFVEYSTHDFRLLATSPAVDAGADSLAAPTDIDGVLRPQGAASDVGAYERLLSTSTTLSSSEAAPTILYPSPASRYIIFNEAVTDVKLFSVSGQLVKSWGEVQMGRQMDCANLVEGLYLVHFQTSTGVQGTAKIFIQRQ